MIILFSSFIYIIFPHIHRETFCQSLAGWMRAQKKQENQPYAKKHTQIYATYVSKVK